MGSSVFNLSVSGFAPPQPRSPTISSDHAVFSGGAKFLTLNATASELKTEHPEPPFPMPASFSGLGLQLLYPDNWTIADDEPASDDGDASGVTFELPGGGFFSIERGGDAATDDAVVDAFAETIRADYGEAEREEIEADDSPIADRICEFRFYYLDLIIVSRIVLATIGNDRFMIQMQAESRDFDVNEPVFSAILKQIGG